MRYNNNTSVHEFKIQSSSSPPPSAEMTTSTHNVTRTRWSQSTNVYLERNESNRDDKEGFRFNSTHTCSEILITVTRMNVRDEMMCEWKS